MARPLRIEFPGAVYHVTGRGNERKDIFRDDQDRETFLNTLHRVIVRYNWLCHAYCLMDNHYHLLLETPEGNLSIGMRQLNGVYTQLFNKKYERVGHLFQGRFKGILVQKDSHLLEVSRYIVLNPVRAAMVESPEIWKWSSYSATAGLKKAHPCLTTDWILNSISSVRKKALVLYREFVANGMQAEPIWKDLKAQSILGEKDFIEGLLDHVKGRELIAEIPKSQRFINRPSLESILSEDAVQDKSRRDECIFEAVQRHGYSQKEVADHTGLYFSSVSRIMAKREMTRKKT